MKVSDLSAEHYMAIDAMKDQLLIVLINRLGGKVDLPVSEIDGTGGCYLMMRLDEQSRTFEFEVRRKGS
ncbi:hypothetical protein NA8A_04738 [Nitratireductor indicus C115]|uniref:Uncharacterized protein n=1 Tax=Nitratireductor indicus C115 TaxID=1231190 RepID=K2NZF6_9HYPH|nr:hypothetical protein [Nitratireductor indicus]EKF43309.1 hypothetical protein NA8A_04738 [Nitratireductor indicus C115]SFQ10390.1 hypothetical protein SAMN05216176_101359 [Nitratireductor indicus]